MSESTGWFEKWTRKIFTWMSQREVKTPLSFYFRLLVAVVIVTVVTLYLSFPEQRLAVFQICIYTLGGLAVLVALLTVFKIKNLVYGEASHRAELKLAMGTEKKEVSAAELALTEGTEKPKELIDDGAA
jgi:hypothetical protein